MDSPKNPLDELLSLPRTVARTRCPLASALGLILALGLPAGAVSQSTCCSGRSGRGCQPTSCAVLVCSLRPSLVRCCTQQWSAPCAFVAQDCCVECGAIPLSVTCPPDMTIECHESSDPAATGRATAVTSGTVRELTHSDTLRLDGCNGTGMIERRWVATDSCGRNAACTQVITVTDTRPPAVPPDVSIECGDSSDPSNTGGPGDCGPVTASFVDVISAGCGNESTIARSWTAVDECGNATTGTQIITVEDMTAPTITCPPDVTLECSVDTSPASTGAATATDGCGGAVVSSSDVVSLDGCNGTGTIARTWTAMDACGNTSTCVQVITVEDTTAPAIACPADVTLECSADTSPAAVGQGTATEDCGVAFVSSSDIVSLDGCNGTGTIMRTWRATDDCGNTATCVQAVTLVDEIPPVIQCPDDVTVECGESTLPADTGSALATDDCDPAPDVTWADSPVGACPTTLTRTWTATDRCGNTRTCTQAITLLDTLSPVLACPDDTSLQCGESDEPTATGAATAVDACDGSPAITFADVVTPQACGGQWQIQRTWTAADVCGNATTCTQEIQVDDTTAPIIACPPDVVVGDARRAQPPISGVPVVDDGCDGEPAVGFTDAETAGSCPEDTAVTRTWRVSDSCGNAVECVQALVLEPCCSPRCEAGCGDSACVDLVCAIDPFCCEDAWDVSCVALAVEHCVTCQHPGDCCTVHDTPGCTDPACARLVCEEAPRDPFCCTTAWDSECAEQALGVCEACMAGPPPPSDGEACDDCGGLRAEVCAALAASGVDPLPASCDID